MTVKRLGVHRLLSHHLHLHRATPGAAPERIMKAHLAIERSWEELFPFRPFRLSLFLLEPLESFICAAAAAAACNDNTTNRRRCKQDLPELNHGGAFISSSICFTKAASSLAFFSCVYAGDEYRMTGETDFTFFS